MTAKRLGRFSPDLVGMTFGRLTVVSRDGVDRTGNSRWICKCECGVVKSILAVHLKSGETISCGCYRKEYASTHPNNFRHGYSHTRIYKAWRAAKSRCNNPKDRNYKYYGGRGITMHTIFQNSFLAFLKELGKRPSKDHSVDRIDNNKGYDPGNLKWSTRSEQIRNSRVCLK